MFAHHPTSTSFRSLVCAASVLFLSLLIVGCASYGPKEVPSLAYSTSSINFQNVLVGQTATQAFRISNTGTAPLQVSIVSISGKQFSLSGPSAPQAIPPKNSLAYTVAFTPTTPGSASATLKVMTNAALAADSISLSGNGEKASANLVITPTSINFGNLTLKSTSTQNVTLQNTGDINLAIQGVTVTGAGFGYSSLSPGFTLAPKQTVTFQVWFSPKVAGPASATVSLLSPNIASAGTLNLTGDGVSSAVTTPSQPSPPPAQQHTVHLTWDASASHVIGYRVYRSESSGGSYGALNGTAITALTFDDTTVSSGTTYYYVVTAVDASGNESVYSNQTTAAIPAS